MTEIFESSLSIIIFALIAGVRLVLYLRKRAARQSQNRPPPLAGIVAIESEGAALAGDEENDEEFSAWALSVESRKPVPHPAAPVRKAVSFPEVLPPVFSEAAPPPVTLPDAQLRSRPAETASLSAKPHPLKAAGGFWEKFGTFPPLRQGVILSEILGPPKGL